MTIDLKPVRSSSISAVGHDPVKNELHVKFQTGATHVYSGVTADQHNALVGAKSIGAHFHQNIRNRYQQRRS